MATFKIWIECEVDREGDATPFDVLLDFAEVAAFETSDEAEQFATVLQTIGEALYAASPRKLIAQPTRPHLKEVK